MMNSRLPVVAIVGRPNVGKSTLFNRLVGSRKAIVGDRPGVTVDRLESRCQCGQNECILVDTGGIGEDQHGAMQSAIDDQVAAALDVADLVLFAVDAQSGATPVDAKLAETLRRSGREVLLVVNKAENAQDAHDFHRLGMGHPWPVSAMHGAGVQEFKRALASQLPDWSDDQEEQKPLASISVIGRPNVGKSTLINAWLGRDRMVVSPIAGTTRDAIDSDIPWSDGQSIRLIDTAGQRKHGRIADVIEFVARVKAVQAFRLSDVAVMVLDGGEGIVEQDMRLMQLAQESGCALLVVVNKSDLLSEADWAYYVERLNFRMRGMPDVAVRRMSAKYHKGIKGLLKAAVAAAERNRFTTTTGELNRWLEQVQRKQHAPSDDGAVVRLKYISQISTRPPTFKVFCNRPKSIKTSYLRFLEQDFRRNFDLSGIPLRFQFAGGGNNPYAELNPQRKETEETRGAQRRSARRRSKRQAKAGGRD